MKPIIFAANWKMHHGPSAAAEFLQRYLRRHRRVAGREVWFFPPAASLDTVAGAVADRPDIVAGAQHIHWEPKGAFTGEISVGIAKEAGAGAALIGHSERRHVFGETDADTALKVRAVLDGGLVPVLCVGEKDEERESGQTHAVVTRQLGALDGLDAGTLAGIVVAYEPVWAIGTGKTPTPADAGQVHAVIRGWFEQRGVAPRDARILYGGSVKPANTAALLAEEEVNGVLVGGASLEPDDWAAITAGELD